MRLPSAERVRDLLSYNPETGDFRWRRQLGSRAPAGGVAGSINAQGYLVIRVDGAVLRAHRLAWLYVHGEWPRDHLDHINGDRLDNRIKNLREATLAENNQNQRKAHRDNKSGMLGVTLHKSSGLWQARIQANKKNHSVGYFKTADEAHAAYLRAKSKLHPFQTITKGSP